MSKPENPGQSSREVFASDPHAVYAIETVEKITHISRDRIILYYQHGLVSPVQTTGESNLLFDDQAIHKLRSIAFLLSEYEINQNGLRMVSALINEVERLREEVRFLREKS